MNSFYATPTPPWTILPLLDVAVASTAHKNSFFTNFLGHFFKKPYVDFSEIHIFLILEMYSLKPTIAHCLGIVTKF